MNNVSDSLAELHRLTSDCVVFFTVRSARRFVVASLNPAAARTFGLDPAAAVGQSPHDLWPADHADVLVRSFGLALDAASTTAEHCWPLPGGPRWFVAQMVPLRRVGQPPHALAVTWRDITAQKLFERTLTDREEMFRQLVETAGVIPWEADFPSARFTYVGPQAYRRIGYPEADWFREGFWESILHPDDRDEAVQTSLTLGRTQREYTFEYRVVAQSGEVIWMRDLVNVVRRPGRTLLRGFLVDVTPLRQAEREARQLAEQLEARVADRTVQLRAANDELEAFCYSVSHDLRAPLRAIDGFGKALLEDYDARLDDDGRDMLRRVRAASQRMGELIDDLLTLSRVSRGEMRRGRVCLTSLAHAVAAALHHAAPQRRVEWVIEPDLSIDGDAALLRVLLENLLGNAWKYTSRQPTARIEFGRTTRDGEPTFFVRDDGAGFDERYADKLFQPFQRLHRPDEFQGHGIGLATVRRIVHRHGGRVAARGAVGRGATFFFTCHPE